MLLPLKPIKKEALYKPNQTIITLLGTGNNRKIEIVTLAMLRTSGLEISATEQAYIRGTVNETKLTQSISRARNNIFHLAYCNEWQFFFTGTVSPDKYNREDLQKIHKDFSQWIRNQNKKYNTKIKYLLIPELHADGKSWHFHGFIKGLPEIELCKFSVGDSMGSIIAKKVLNGEIVYNWLSYSKKFGYCSLEPIRSIEGVSKYITKYISKNLATSVKDLNAHLYYHSRGLSKGVVIKKGSMSANIPPDFENEYCTKSIHDYDEQFLQDLLNSFS